MGNANKCWKKTRCELRVKHWACNSLGWPTKVSPTENFFGQHSSGIRVENTVEKLFSKVIGHCIWNSYKTIKLPKP